jgi:hypothetical protein
VLGKRPVVKDNGELVEVSNGDADEMPEDEV